MSEENDPPNIYQIPQCTICLRQLASDIFNLSCGHVFHLPCIGQHFQYRGTCPNCQKKAYNKQLRQVIYNVNLIGGKGDHHVNSILKNMDPSEKQPLNAMIKEVKVLTEKKSQVDDENKRLSTELLKTLQLYEKTKQQSIKYKKQNQVLKKQRNAFAKSLQNLQIEAKQLRKENLDNQIVIENYKKRQSEWDLFNRYRKIVCKPLQETMKYKNELQSTLVPAEERCKIFFQMLQMSKLENLRLKEKVQDHPSNIKQLENQLLRAKDKSQKSKKEVQEAREARNQQRKKYEELKIKYKALLQKFKKDNTESNIEYEDSMGTQSRKVKVIPSMINEIQLSKPIIEKRPSILNQSYGGFNLLAKKEKPRGNLESFVIKKQ